MNLKQLREARGITQTELAKQLGVVRSTICFYESEQHSPTPEMLIKLADFFGVTVDYLLGRDEPYAALSAPGVQMKPAAESELTATEQELLSIYRSVNPALQELILNVARTAAGNPTDPDSPAGAMALKKQA